MSYDPAAGDQIIFQFGGTYTPPEGGNIQLGGVPPIITFRNTLRQGWDLLTVDIMQALLLQPLRLDLARELGMAWNIQHTFFGLLLHAWPMPMAMLLRQYWSDMSRLKSSFFQPLGNTRLLRENLLQPWVQMLLSSARLEQYWSIREGLQKNLAQLWPICAEHLSGSLQQNWPLPAHDLLAAMIEQVWASTGANAAFLRYRISLRVDGHDIAFKSLSIEESRDQAHISLELELANENDFQRARIASQQGGSVELTWQAVEWGVENGLLEFKELQEESYHLIPDPDQPPSISESHGSTRYAFFATSAVTRLAAPHSLPLNGDLSGQASAIASSLAGDMQLFWQTVDWHIPAALFQAEDSPPLELLRHLAEAVGAVIQSAPDGTILIQPEYPRSVPDWLTARPDHLLIEVLEFASTERTPEIREGHNRFLVSDEGSASEGLRLEAEEESSYVKLVRGYQTPWQGNFDIRHTGGEWVQIEQLGIEEREEEQVVEFVAGASQVSYPIFAILSHEWLRLDLGAISFAEDGKLTAEIAAESLLLIRYQTRCRLWRVRDDRDEQVQVVEIEE